MEFPDISELLDSGYSQREDKLWPTYHGGYLDRTKYVSASEIGGCARKIKFGKMQSPRPFRRWGWAERGHMIEAWAIPLIRDGIEALPDSEDWVLLFAGERQVSFYYEDQSGTPDGLLLHRPTRRGIVVDCKSIDPRTHRGNLPKKRQIDQVTQNMDLIECNTEYEVVGGVLLFIDASDLQDRIVKEVDYDEDRMIGLRDRAKQIMEAKSPKDLPPEGLHMDKECDLCEFQHRCSDLIREEQLDRKAMLQAERASRVVFR